ncbi:hypothetical protein BC827DRAFT_168035 [Russula dissimulans]|nr:hypothetical protein BC827DRAFT_168035 [Russula dissimulans]
MKDTQLMADLVIGILGTSTTFLCRSVKFTWKRFSALQGAFAEHQAMLLKISGKRGVEVVQVRTPEELKGCDALIIPGGDRQSSSIHSRRTDMIMMRGSVYGRGSPLAYCQPLRIPLQSSRKFFPLLLKVRRHQNGRRTHHLPPNESRQHG